MKILFCLILSLVSVPLHAEEKMRVYFIGNSLTASLTLDRVHALAEQRGIDLQFGSQLSGGKSLIRHLNYTDEPDQNWVSWETNAPSGDTFQPDSNPYHGDEPAIYGKFETALKYHQWDKVVMQLYGGTLHDDLEAISAFIDLSLANKTCEHFYIYSTWPRRPVSNVDGKRVAGNIDYPATWSETYTAKPDDTSKKAGWNYNSASYVDQLMTILNDRYAGKCPPIRLIPAGEVLLELDRKIKQGELPGLAELAERKPELVPGLDHDSDFSHGVNVLYADPIHLNPIPHKGDTVGIFVSGTTVFTVLTGENPIGLSAAPYGMDDQQDDKLIRTLESTIWDVVTADDRTGVQ